MLFVALDAKAELEREMAADSTMPAIKHHESRECVGMFEYRKDEEQLLVDNLIAGKWWCLNALCQLAVHCIIKMFTVTVNIKCQSTGGITVQPSIFCCSTSFDSVVQQVWWLYSIL